MERTTGALTLGAWITALILLFASGIATAADNTGTIKIGDITSYSGQVMVRSAGQWTPVGELPHPIYNTDKVVTKQGRAEVELVDTGILRMDANSNITIVQQMEGPVNQRRVAGRQVNVLVGKVLFDVRLSQKGPKEFKVRTPGMVAAVRGTRFPVAVNAAGDTHYDLEGDATVTGGERSDLIAAGLLSMEDITAARSDLPPVDRHIDSLPFQRIALEAGDKTHNLARLHSRSRALNELVASDASTDSRDLSRLKIRAAAANAATSQALAEVAVSDAQAALYEAHRMSRPISGETAYYEQGVRTTHIQLLAVLEQAMDWLIPTARAADPLPQMTPEEAKDALAAAKASLELATTAAKSANLAAEQAQDCGADCTAEELRLLAAQATANASLAAAEADVAVATAQVAYAGFSGDADTLNWAATALEKAINFAATAHEAANYANRANDATQGISLEELELLVVQIQAAAQAAQANSSAAEAQQTAAQTIIQGVARAKATQDQADKAGESAIQATAAMMDARNATTLDGANAALSASEDAAKKAAQESQTTANIAKPASGSSGAAGGTGGNSGSGGTGGGAASPDGSSEN